MTVRTMSAQQQKRFIKHMEAQGCEVVKKKAGFVIRTPDGGSESVHISYGDRMGLQADISRFRRRGLHHPDDPKEPPMPTTDAEYPGYITSPITSVTRRRILADLEAKGWPLEVRSTEINLDTATANRALFAVGYRWHPKSSPTKKLWVAPDEIREMHEKVKAEMKQREEEARAARKAAHVVVEAGDIVVTAAPSPADIAARVRDAARENMAGHEGVAGHPMQIVKKPEMPTAPPVTEEPDLRGDITEKVPTAEIVPDEPPVREPETEASQGEQPAPEVQVAGDREFIDTMDSWTVDIRPWSGIPAAVKEYIQGLQAAGLAVEIRVWKDTTPRA